MSFDLAPSLKCSPSMESINRVAERLWAKLCYAGWWPAYLFYTPVVMMFLWLSVKYRGMSFLYSNPGLFFSGCMDDSKTEMDRMLRGTADKYLLKTESFPSALGSEDRIARFEKFMERSQLQYPIVIKPDGGLRGLGVKVIKSCEDAIEYLTRANVDMIAQEFCRLPYEGTVYFYQDPETKKAKIYSVAYKKNAQIFGDGYSSVRELVNRHKTVKHVSHNLFNDMCANWDGVLEPGEEFIIDEPPCVWIGANFIDARHLIGEEMYAWLEPVLQKLFENGVHIGRFDMKFADEQSFVTGENLHILEVNGVSAEAIHLYDRKFTPFQALAIYYEQLELGFKIGYHNKEKYPETNASMIGFVMELRRFFLSKQDLVDLDNFRVSSFYETPVAQIEAPEASDSSYSLAQ